MINISAKAKEVLDRKKLSTPCILKIGLKNGGCSGMTYDAAIVEAVLPENIVVFKEKDLVVVSNKQDVELLEGLSIDYSEDLISAGFRFSNASNDSSCGCGASFKLSGFPVLQTIGESCGN